MIIFVAGMSRSGSMWTYNVARAILEAKNILVLPKLIPVNERDLIKIALKSEEKENEVYCIKTHLLLNNPLPTKHEVKIICNIRDVRDACLSFMRFMHADYETGVRAMISMMQKTDCYLTSFKDNLLEVRFEELTNSPLTVIETISNFLKIDLSENEKNKILIRFDKSNIQQQLSKMANIKIDKKGQVIGAKQKSKFDTAQNLDGTFRVFDKATSFQSNHITSNTDGEWKTHFDKNQIKQLNNITKEWLLKHGYKV